jgi:hypothetical protein
MGEQKMGRGYDAARTFLKENKPILTQLLKDIRKGLNEGGVIARTAASSDE